MAMAPIQRNVTWWNWRQSRPAGCSSTCDLASGSVPRPWILLSSFRSSCSFTDCACGLTVLGCCCAKTGAVNAVVRHKSIAALNNRNGRRIVAIISSP
jgi:hypothetical protein